MCLVEGFGDIDEWVVGKYRGGYCLGVTRDD